MTTTATAPVQQSPVERQVQAAEKILADHNLSLSDFEGTVVDFFLFYFQRVTKSDYQQGETRRGEVAARLARAELAEQFGEDTLTANDVSIATCFAYATVLTAEAYEQIVDTATQQAAACLAREQLIDAAKGRVDWEKVGGTFERAITVYFETLLRVGRLDVFIIDADGHLRRETLVDATWRLAREALCAELGENFKHRESTVKKGLGLCSRLTRETIRSQREQKN